MKAHLEARLLEEKRRSAGRMKTPADLLNRKVSPEDFVDSAVIGGVSVANIVAGKISEHQIPKDVVKAFHEQYPNVRRSFAAEVRRLARDPERLMGFVNGVKGKLFEDQYVQWLNQGHLPAGLHAELAHSATNPAWDIAIKDSSGHVDEVLQLKASADLAYIQSALEAHPDIDVVVPHDVYAQLAQHGDLSGHLLDSTQSLHDLGGQVGSAVDHATAADVAFHIPVLAVAFAVGHSFYAYRTGKLSLSSAIRSAAERSLLAGIATGFGYVIALATQSTLAGIPVAIWTRIMAARALRNFRLRGQFDASIERCGAAAKALCSYSPLALAQGTGL